MFSRNRQPLETTDDGVVRFQQKRGGRRVHIAIDKTGVNYEMKDINGENRFRVSFEQIDPETSRIVEKNGWLLRFGIIWMLLGLCATLPDPKDMLPTAGIFVVFGACAFFYYFWRRAAFSVLRTERGRMCIIENAWHDDILREMNLRRVATLRRKYLQIDHENNSHAELGKYNWLRRVGAITDVELSQFSSMLQGDAESLPGVQPPTISLN